MCYTGEKWGGTGGDGEFGETERYKQVWWRRIMSTRCLVGSSADPVLIENGPKGTAADMACFFVVICDLKLILLIQNTWEVE